MNIDTTMTEGEAYEFNLQYATLFLTETIVTYFEAVQAIYSLKGDNYTTNKLKEAETACIKAIVCIKRNLTAGMPEQQKEIALQAVEHHKGLVYEIFSLEVDEQARVRNLITKLKKERR